MSSPVRCALVLLASVGGVAACERGPSATERAREDARAVAMVEAAQRAHPPPVALTPQALSAAELTGHRLTGSACRFTARTGQVPAGTTETLLLVNGERALLKLEDRFITLAADGGSPELVPAVRHHYVGKAQSLTLERPPGDGSALGVEGLRWPAVLTIRDPWQQIVFTAPGALVC
ncbi:hypothetical protein ACFOON_16595 [Novosphingobium piscinae]|uniref:Lipoprotein n=1 Tax=Novosphingobium piscinae TaxID=1507448 RepID=A0A7X1FYL6_9SPHN|nr:hypothetical protein [Novosphingobium piscinae]MBC2669409.1 hypothetical protein [Novosphingobium piscinae]